MGSGCSNSSNPYNCTNPVSSNCVIYQGDAIPALGICRGDTITEVMAVIIDELQNALDGTSITLSSLTYNCSFITEQLAGKNKTLANLMQVLFDSSCTLKELIDDINNTLNSAQSYDTDCITPTSSTTQGVIQGIINKLCTLDESVTNITDSLGTSSVTVKMTEISGNTLINNIKSGYGVTKTGTGANAQVSFYGFVPPFCPIPCIANLSNFDSSGKGISGGAYDGFYICNGNNSTPDMRGYIFGGATTLPGISGPALQTTVDPTNDATYAAAIGDRKGEVKHTLSTAELPSHSHSFANSTHSHTYPGFPYRPGTGTISPPAYVILSSGTGIPLTSSSSTIGGDSSSVGSNTSHENRQPTYYGYFIMRKN